MNVIKFLGEIRIYNMVVFVAAFGVLLLKALYFRDPSWCIIEALAMVMTIIPFIISKPKPIDLILLASLLLNMVVAVFITIVLFDAAEIRAECRGFPIYVDAGMHGSPFGHGAYDNFMYLEVLCLPGFIQSEYGESLVVKLPSRQ